MRVSHPVAHRDGLLQIPAKVRESLQLPHSCLLHGRFIDDSQDCALVLSPIRLSCWDRCFRVTVYITHHHGSLAMVLSALEKHKLTVQYLLATAVSSRGDACVNAIVTPTEAHFSPAKPIEYGKRLEGMLRKEKALKTVLSGASWFDRPGEKDTFCYTIKVTPLLLLRAVGKSELGIDGLGRRLGIAGDFQNAMTVPLIDGTLNLADCRVPYSGHSTPPLAMDAHSVLSSDSNSHSHHALITADAQECHLQLCLLPQRRFVVVSATLQTGDASPADHCGLVRRLAEAMAGPPNGINLYHVSSFVIEQTATKVSEGTYKETSKIRVVGETHISKHSVPDARLQERLLKAMNRNIAGQPSHPTINELRVRPLLAPLVFVATNAKRGVDSRYLKMGVELCRALKEMDLRPVFLETLGGTPIARDQMTRLLDASPITVSYLIPEPDLTLRRSPGRGKVRYAAPSWPIFEEAYQSSKKHRFTFRLIEHSVFSPPHIDRVVELPFADERSFRDRLGRIRERVESERAKESWRTAQRDCAESIVKGDIGLEEIAQHDPEPWFERALDTR